ncbi:MAG: EamA family transporter [Clostridia bacterium]|nr:EamA family transporter [Clostridia bacterium]
MPYLYLIISVFGATSSSIFGSFFNRKNADKKDASPVYSLICLSTIFCFWLVMFLFDRTLDWSVLPYSLGFALAFASCALATVYALQTGPVVLTSLILQLSLIGTTTWGFFFWNTPFTWLVAVGLVLIVVALWLCLYTKKEEENKISAKWLFWVSVMFVGNAACSIIQRTQQMNYGGKYGNFLMTVAMLFAVLFCLIVYLKSDKSDTKEIVKGSWHFPVAGGVLNAVMNLCIMLLAATSLSPSLIYPVLAIGSLSVTTVFSAFVFKEKMRWWQWVGVAVGAVAVALLSI